MTDLAPHIQPRRFHMAMLTRSELAVSLGELSARQVDRLERESGRYEFLQGYTRAIETLIELWGLDQADVDRGRRQEQARIRLRSSIAKGSR